MDDLLEQDLTDADDAKEVSQFPRYMVRNVSRPETYWSDTGGWSTYAEADTYLPVDLEHKELPAGGQWVGLEEAVVASMRPEKELNELLPQDFSDQVHAKLSSGDCLVEQEWHQGSRVIGGAHVAGPVLIVRVVMSPAESSRIHSGHKTESSTDEMAKRFKSQLVESLPVDVSASVKVFSVAPRFDRWNGQWVFETGLVAWDESLREDIDDDDDEDADYKDLHTLPLPKQFDEPKLLTPDGEKAWSVIVNVLAEEGVRSAGGCKVFYSPRAWEARDEEFGLDSLLIVVHDGGDHAPYFNLDYEGYIAHAKMDLALSRAGLYAETCTNWYSAIYKKIPSEQQIAHLEQWIKQHDRPKKKIGIGESIEDDDEADLKDVMGDSPTVQKVYEAFLKFGLEPEGDLITTRLRDRPTVIVSAKSKPYWGWTQDNWSIAHSIGGHVVSEIKEHLGVSAMVSMRFWTAENRWIYDFWMPLPISPTQEAFSDEDDEDEAKELVGPETKQGRIQQLFTNVGLHIESMIEMPADPGWGDLGQPQRFIETVLQPDAAKQWTTAAMAAPELAYFLRRMMSNLGEILETTDIDYTTSFDQQLGAWRIKWYIGDPEITQRNVAESDETDDSLVEHSAEGDDDRIAIVAVFREKDEGGYETLIVLREVDPEAGKWCVAGGHAQVGEKIEDGARREMKEETHLDLGELTFIKKMRNETRDAYVYVYGTMLPKGEKAKPGDDAEKLKWVPMDDLPELAFDNNELLAEIAEKMELTAPLTESHGIDSVLAYMQSIRQQLDQARQEAIDRTTDEHFKKSLEHGHGRYEGTCGHVIKQCRCSSINHPGAILVEVLCQQCAEAAEQPKLAEEDKTQTVEAERLVLFERLIGEDKAKNKFGKNGLLVVFEGIDGAGKTTQVSRLADWLNEKDFSYVTTKWNSSKILSDALWKAKRKKKLTPMTYSLLHASDMHLRYENIIVPALKKGKVTLCDRYYYTSFVRDSIRDIPKDLLDIVYEGFRKPDLIFHCKVPVKVAVERLMAERGVNYYSSGQDVGYKTKGVEKTTEAYEQDMADHYDKLFKNEPNVVELDMDRPIKEIAKDIKREVKKRLGLEETD